jgi:hypothetical protein
MISKAYRLILTRFKNDFSVVQMIIYEAEAILIDTWII